MVDDVSFSKARKIPSAYAGILVDWSIGAREVSATLIDLIVRRNVEVVGEHLELRNLKTKFKFEKKFLKNLFGDKKKLSFAQVKKKAYDTSKGGPLSIIADKLVEEGYVNKNLGKIAAKKIMGKNSLFMKFIKKNMKENMKKDPKYMDVNMMNYSRVNSIVGGIIGKILLYGSWAYLIFLGLVVLGMGVFFISSLYYDASSAFSFLLFELIIFGILAIPGLIAILIIRHMKKGEKMMNDIDWALTAKGKRARSESLKLMKYMKTYPHVEDRLANELVGHSVAFGIGQEWMKKLGGMRALNDLVFEKYGSKDVHMYFMDENDYARQFFDS